MTQTASSSLRRELARAVADVRGGWNAGPIADEILARDRVSTYLVGLYENGECVIYYERARNAIVGYPFRDGDVAGGERRVVERVNKRGDLRTWIANQDVDQWDWIHPRYRWLCERHAPEPSGSGGSEPW